MVPSRRPSLYKHSIYFCWQVHNSSVFLSLKNQLFSNMHVPVVVRKYVFPYMHTSVSRRRHSNISISGEGYFLNCYPCFLFQNVFDFFPSIIKRTKLNISRDDKRLKAANPTKTTITQSCALFLQFLSPVLFSKEKHCQFF